MRQFTFFAVLLIVAAAATPVPGRADDNRPRFDRHWQALAAEHFRQCGDCREAFFDQRGDRIDARLDRQAEQIIRQFTRRAERAEALGKEKLAAHLRAKGEWIAQRLDRQGDWLNDLFDRRGEFFSRSTDRWRGNPGGWHDPGNRWYRAEPGRHFAGGFGSPRYDARCR